MADLLDDPVASTLDAGDWEWDSVLDFSLGSFPGHILPWQSEELSDERLLASQALEVQQVREVQNASPRNQSHDAEEDEKEAASGRIRKRDPRLTCSNFLAGRVPCACPEMDNMEEELSRKRAKVVVLRCQVPSCEADISHLKGYHRRHRVCLSCANAAIVVLDDVPQRYCQQCGKFHLLTDFDEGKRSCRRKLERHNNRRRRKPVNVVEGSVQQQTLRAESALQNAEDTEPHNDGKSRQASKSFSSLGCGEKQSSSGSEEINISEVEQPYKGDLSLKNVGPKSADVSKVTSSVPVKVSTELEGKLLPERDMGNGEKFNDQDVRVVDNSQAILFVGPQNGDNGSTYAELNEQSYTGMPMEESSRKDRFPHNASGRSERDEGAGPLKSSLSSNRHDKHFSYTSVCPTGRISFKLYDWNPAEFPRRLRQQILQWLADMPIELEGYIRPGCTILTAFISLPQFMWEKLSANSPGYIHSLLNGSQSILLDKGNMLVYLNDIVMQIKNGEACLVNTKMDMRIPKLHSVHPIFFEAGCPIEIVACGRNLFRSNYRFLISFHGNYIHYGTCEAIPLGNPSSSFRSKENIFHSSNHESFKILIPSTDPRLFGPAFIEVENEYGISNFIPILIGDKQICSEFQMLEQELVKSGFCSRSNHGLAVGSSSSDICEQNLVKRQSILELLVDIGWVLKDPESDEDKVPVNFLHIQRLNCLFSYLINGHFLAITEKVLHSPKVVKMLRQVYGKSNEVNGADMKLLQNYVEHAWQSLRKKRDYKGTTDFQSFLDNVVLQGFPPPLTIATLSCNQQPCTVSHENQETERLLKIRPEIRPFSEIESSDTRVLSVEENNMLTPLLEKECSSNIAGDLKYNSTWRGPKIEVAEYTRKMKVCLKGDIRVDRRIFILAITVISVCAGICVVLQHPHQVMEISMSLRRCLSGLRKAREDISHP